MARLLTSRVRRVTAARLMVAAAGVAAAASCLPRGRPAPLGPQYASLCLDDAGTHAVALTVVQLVTRAGASGDSLRQGTGLLPAAAADVVVPSDTATCRRAAAAHRAMVAPTDRSALQPVDVIRAGPLRYVVRDPNAYNPKSEWLLYTVYDTAFVAVGGWVH